MDDQRQRVHGVAVDEDVQLHERRFPVAGHVVVERRVAARDDLQLVVEVEDDLVERQLVGDAARGRDARYSRSSARRACPGRAAGCRRRYSFGVRMVAVMTGSSIFAMRTGVGQLRRVVDLVHARRRSSSRRSDTPGAVVIRSRSNSRSSRSWTISMCSRPRKPQRNPKPSAVDVSGSKKNERR